MKKGRTEKYRELTDIIDGHINLRADGRIEWVCAHGVGHTIGHKRGFFSYEDESIHGCDGCCSKIPSNCIMKIRKKK